MTARSEGKIVPPNRTADIGAIILPHLDAAYNLARWLVRDATLAEDVVQDAVTRALRYIASYEGGDARAWWMRIVRNAAYDALATRRNTPLAEPLPNGWMLAEQIADPADDPEVALSRQQDRAILAAALDALDVELRECLVLRELEQLSYKEIAHVVGVPIGTIMSRLWRARRALADIAAKGTKR